MKYQYFLFIFIYSIYSSSCNNNNSTNTTTTTTCNSHGKCINNICFCQFPYFGYFCEKYNCYGIENNHQYVCNEKRGICIKPNICKCDGQFQWVGDECEEWIDQYGEYIIQEEMIMIKYEMNMNIIENDDDDGKFNCSLIVSNDNKEIISRSMCYFQRKKKNKKKSEYLIIENVVLTNDMLINDNYSIMIKPVTVMDINNETMVFVKLIIRRNNFRSFLMIMIVPILAYCIIIFCVFYLLTTIYVNKIQDKRIKKKEELRKERKRIEEEKIRSEINLTKEKIDVENCEKIILSEKSIECMKELDFEKIKNLEKDHFDNTIGEIESSMKEIVHEMWENKEEENETFVYLSEISKKIENIKDLILYVKDFSNRIDLNDIEKVLHQINQRKGETIYYFSDFEERIHKIVYNINLVKILKLCVVFLKFLKKKNCPYFPAKKTVT